MKNKSLKRSLGGSKNNKTNKNYKKGGGFFSSTPTVPIDLKQRPLNVLRKMKGFSLCHMNFTTDGKDETLEISFAPINKGIKCLGIQRNLVSALKEFISSVRSKATQDEENNIATSFEKVTCFSEKNKIKLKYNNDKLESLTINENPIFSNIPVCMKTLIDIYVRQLVAKGKIFTENGQTKYTGETVISETPVNANANVNTNANPIANAI